MSKRKRQHKNIEKVKVIDSKFDVIDDQNESDSPIMTWINNNRRLTYTLMALFVGLVSFFLYYNTIDYDLVYCDDNIFVMDFQEFNKDIDNIWESFNRTFGTSYYRPILGMSFLIDANIGIWLDLENTFTNPMPFQLSNNIYHIIGSILVFIFLIQLRYNIIAVFFFSLLFSVHPILTPAVSWISGRNDSLITIFILLSFMTNISYYRAKKPDLKYSMLLLHLFFFTIALFTKEIATMYTLLVVGYNLFFREGILEKVNNKYKINFANFFSKENLILAGGWIVVTLIWNNLRSKAFEGITNPDEIGISAFFANIQTPFAMIGKIFLPIKMIALSTFENFSVISGAIIIVALIALAFKIADVRKRHILFGLTWFMIFLGPTLFIRILNVDDFFDYAEHRAYLIMVGIFVIVLEIMKGLKINYSKPQTILALTLIVLIFGYKSYNYKFEFDGRKNFWSHMTEMYPYKARGYLDLGKAYLVKGELNEADSLYNLGIERNPENVNFYIDLSVVKIQKREFAEAERLAKIAVDLNAKDGRSSNGDKLAFTYLGTAQLSQNKFQEAMPNLLQAINLGGGKDWDVLHKYAVCLHNTGNYEEAIKYYSAALRINPKDFQAMTNYGVALSHTGNGDSEKILRHAVTLNPKAEVSYINLINHLIKVQKIGEIQSVVNIAKQNGVALRDNVQAQLKSLGIQV